MVATPLCDKRNDHVGPERRRHPRVCRRGAVFFARDGASYARGHVLDLSRGGLRLATRERLEVGTEIYLGLLLDISRSALVVSALVHRCEETDGGFEVGLEFTSTSSEAARALARLATNRLPQRV